MRKAQPHYKVNHQKFKDTLQRHGLTAMGLSLASYHGQGWLTNMAAIKGYLTQDAVDLLEQHGIKREEWEYATERD